MKNLLARLQAFWTEGGQGAAAPGLDGERRLAAAALLVEAARQDGDYAQAEKALIKSLLVRHFALSDEEADALMAAAEAAQDAASDVFGFTRRAIAGLDEEGREALVEMLWEVVLADGVIRDEEGSLMRRIASLLHVSDHASAAARRRAVARLMGQD